MSQRIDKSWLVFASIANFEHDRCVDFFSRPDGSFGFEEVRRDPEDRGAWTPVQYHSRTTSVRRAVRWHGRNCDGVRPLTFSTAADLTSRASVTRRPPGDLFPSPGQFGRGSPVFLKNNPRQSKWNKVSGIRRGEEAVAPPHGRRSPFERFDPCLAKAKKPSGATTPQAESAAHLIFWISSRDSLIRSRTRRYSARASRV